MTEPPSPIPPGWYQDPAEARRFRWWDGLGWTEHVREPEPVPPVVAPVVAPVVHSQPAVPNVPPLPVPPWAIDGPAEAAYRPFGSTITGTAGAVAAAPLPPVIVTTVWVWLIALSPVWGGAISLIAAAASGAEVAQTSGTSASARDPLGALVAALAVFLALVFFASRDRVALLRSGHPSAASTWWMLLFPPVAYLIARRIRVKRWTGRGAAPGNVFALLYLVPLVLGILLAVLLPLLIAGSNVGGSP